MTWDFLTPKGRDGAFRNLMMTVENEVATKVNSLWDALPKLKDEQIGTAVKLGSQDAGVKAQLKDLMYLMISEHAEYRRKIHLEHGSYDNAEEPGQAMMIDNRQQLAWHLASQRAEARLTGKPVPNNVNGQYYDWMDI